jgi:hypothetical protein
VDPVPETLLVRKSGSAGSRTRISGSVARNSRLLDHRGGAQVTAAGTPYLKEILSPTVVTNLRSHEITD